jgi:large subunit ribosomal protein L5
MPAMLEKFSYKSVMAVPKMEKVVVSMGVGKAVADKKFLDSALKDLTVISGQKPLICAAKKSVSNFKVREGVETGLKVTLRKERMYDSMGLQEQSVFPEIDPGRIENTQGMNITFVTTARTDEEGRELLKLFGMPFKE